MGFFGIRGVLDVSWGIRVYTRIFSRGFTGGAGIWSIPRLEIMPMAQTRLRERYGLSNADITIHVLLKF